MQMTKYLKPVVMKWLSICENDRRRRLQCINQYKSL
jgi:hypothetical protein